MIKSFSNAFELRQALLEVLTADPSVLGQFNQGEHSGLEAIWVTPPDPPAGVNGIRCIIQRTPEGTAAALGSRQVHRDEIWVVTITNYNPENKLTAEAKLRLETHFLLPNSSTLQPKYLSPTGVSFEQVLFWLWRPIAIDRNRI